VRIPRVPFNFLNDSTDTAFSGYNGEGLRGIPHTRISTKLTQEGRDVASAETGIKIDTKHTETV
jgi:hypothetical protein